MSGGMTERQVQLIHDFKPDIIMVTPSYMLAIAEEMERQGMDPRDSSLKIGIFGAEPWTPAMRTAIEAKVDIDAIDIYGLSEIIGPGVAQECIETKDGLTIWEDHFYPEIVDPETGKVLPDGEKGELVFTSLTKEALPMIRYRTRDLTRLLPPTARSMRRMEKITGRSDDMLIIRGVNVFPTQIEELILKEAELVPHYQLEITRPKNLDEMAVLVERSPAVGSADGDAAGATARAHGQVDDRRDGGSAGRPAGHDRALARQGEARRRQAAEVGPAQDHCAPHKPNPPARQRDPRLHLRRHPHADRTLRRRAVDGAHRRPRRDSDPGADRRAIRRSTGPPSTRCSTAAPIRRARTTATSRAWRRCWPDCPPTCRPRPSTACAARASMRSRSRRGPSGRAKPSSRSPAASRA